MALLLLLPVLGWAQSRKELEKKRDALDKQIKTTSALIGQAQREQKTTQQQVQLIDAQIGQRQELIGTMNSEIFRVDQEIQETQELVRSLQADLARLKEEYARMVQYAYMNRNAYDRLSYIFAAQSFAQAFKRSRYLEQLAEQRRQQAALIEATGESLNGKLQDLSARRDDKAKLLGRQLDEKKKLTQDKSSQQSTLSTLKKEEGRLRETLNKQQRQRTELATAIKRAIESEVKKTTTRTPAKGGSPAKTTEKLELNLTPEAKELNADFEKNKGKLPWPVEKGTITSVFGKQSHPVLKGIIIENNGIDIGCEKGASVRAMFRGEVSSVIVIPGAGKAVVVSHGAYRTVYSNLRDTSVDKGQKVETKQALGVVMTEDGESTAHVEIWKITADGLVKVDPGAWIYR